MIISIHAAREGGDDDFVPFELKSVAFQSTPPVKAATAESHRKRDAKDISIHAAREGGDHAGADRGQCLRYFNPRRP